MRNLLNVMFGLTTLIFISVGYAGICVLNQLTGTGSGQISAWAFSSGAQVDATGSPVTGYFCTNKLTQKGDYVQIQVQDIYYNIAFGVTVDFNDSAIFTAYFLNTPDPYTDYLITVNGVCNTTGENPSATITVTASDGIGTATDLSFSPTASVLSTTIQGCGLI